MISCSTTVLEYHRITKIQLTRSRGLSMNKLSYPRLEDALGVLSPITDGGFNEFLRYDILKFKFVIGFTIFKMPLLTLSADTRFTGRVGLGRTRFRDHSYVQRGLLQKPCGLGPVGCWRRLILDAPAPGGKHSSLHFLLYRKNRNNWASR